MTCPVSIIPDVILMSAVNESPEIENKNMRPRLVKDPRNKVFMLTLNLIFTCKKKRHSYCEEEQRYCDINCFTKAMTSHLAFLQATGDGVSSIGLLLGRHKCVTDIWSSSITIVFSYPSRSI